MLNNFRRNIKNINKCLFNDEFTCFHGKVQIIDETVIL